MLPPLGPLLSLLSGTPLIVLGLALLAVRPRRGEQAFFAAFAVLWGCQIVAANLGVVLDDAAVFRRANLVSLGLLPAIAVLLVHFVVRSTGTRRGAWITGALALTALAADAVLLWRPEWSAGTVSAAADGGLGAVRIGPAAFWLHSVPLFAAFYAAVALLYRAYRAAPPGSPRHRLRGMLMAMGVYTAFATVNNLVRSVSFAQGAVSYLQGEAYRYVFLFSVGTLLLAVLVGHMLLRPLLHERRDTLLLLAFVVPASLGAGDRLIDTELWSVFSVGTWRFVAVAAVVHTVARYRLFDLQTRLAAWAPALLVGFATAVALPFAALAAAVGEPAVAAAALAAGAALVVVVFATRRFVSGWFLDRNAQDPAHLAQRRFDVYRAALGAATMHGGDGSNDPLVAQLRKSLRISEREHRRVWLALERARPDSRGGRGPAPAGPWDARFLVDRPLRSGRLGRTFRAIDASTQRPVALKIVREDAIGGAAARILRAEMAALRSIDHPRVVRLVDSGEGEGFLWLATEWVDGGDLDGLLRRSGRLSAAQAVSIASDVLEALAAVHARGLIHGDIKPHNILIDPAGRARLADFGLARDHERKGRSSTLVGAGTLLFMAPEQVRGGAPDARTDLYAVAVVLYRMAAGGFYIPITGRDDFQIRQAILEFEPRLEDPALRPLAPVLMRGLAKDPLARWPSAEAMNQALRECAALGGSRPGPRARPARAAGA